MHRDAASACVTIKTFIATGNICRMGCRPPGSPFWLHMSEFFSQPILTSHIFRLFNLTAFLNVELRNFINLFFKQKLSFKDCVIIRQDDRKNLLFQKCINSYEPETNTMCFEA